MTVTEPAGTPSSPKATLTVEEDGVRRTYRLAGPSTIGREPPCDVLLGSPTVSRRHAVVAPDGEGWSVRDLGSGNGTFLDGKRVDEAPLPNGVAIRFGSVPAWFEEDAEPATSGRKVGRTLTLALSVPPARRTRKKAAVAALAGGIALLLGASLWQRGCERRATGATGRGVAESPGGPDVPASPAR